MRHIVLIAFVQALWPVQADAATVTYSVLIDTSPLSETKGSLDFNFEPGPFGSRAATAQILRFGGSGLPSGGTSLSGDASGSLPGDLLLDNGTGFNDYFQGYTFGSTLSFDVALDGPALGSPFASSSGSTFAFSLFSDSSGTVPALTNDSANGYAVTVDINPDGSTSLRNYTNQSTAVTPEPSTATLIFTAAILATVSKLREARVRTNS